MPDGSYYDVTIYNPSSGSPTIYSQGYVPSPGASTRYICRTVRVSTTSSGVSLFTKAILARGTINFAGDMQVNSYDSSNTNYSNPNGTYNTNKYLANGWVASMASSGTAIDLAGALIYGGIQYPAGASYNLGSGIVGDAAYVNNPSDSGTIESGYTNNTLNVSIPATPFPTNGSGATVDPSTWAYVPPLAHTITTNGISNVAYVLTSGDYSFGSDTIHNQSIYVVPGAKVRIYLGKNGRLQMGSSDVIKIPPNSTLQIYNDSSSDAVFTGIANDSQLATNFYYWGLPDTAGSKLTLTGGGYFAGAIYAYYQDVILTGGSSGNTRDFYGALVANSVVNSGHFWMSFDQALSDSSSGSFVMQSWTEL